MSVAGPITRTARDAATLLGVLAGDAALAAIDTPAAVTIARSVRSPSPLGRPGAHQRAAVAEAADVLAGAGHTLEDAAPPYPPTLLNDWGAAWLAGIAQEAERLGLDESELEPRTRSMVRRGRRVIHRGGPSSRMLGRWTDKVTAWMAPYDVLLMPVTARTPGPAGSLDGKGYRSTYLAAARSVPMAQAWNLAGFPAVAVPVGTREGLPRSVQLIGRPGSEPLLLGLATQLGA
jgi:amidase